MLFVFGRLLRLLLFAMKTREDKTNIVGELEERFKKQRVSVFANFTGISVAKLSQFRRELKKIGAEFKVAKKTLLNRALKAAGLEVNPDELKGEVGVIFGYEDQAAPAKLAAKFAKENKTFKVIKGILEGKITEAAGIMALAKLPSREELLGQVARAFNSPIQGLVNALSGNIKNLVVVLSKIKSTKSE